MPGPRDATPAPAESGPRAARRSAADAIDVAQLTAATLGDKNLEREILVMFDGQLKTLLEQMVDEQPEKVAPLAHMLVGSARGIGACKMAAAAEALERAARDGDNVAFAAARERLDEAVEDVKTALTLIGV
jgi:HPt (histidine-containing phosphotransfer) domain-containing protein